MAELQHRDDSPGTPALGVRGELITALIRFQTIVPPIHKESMAQYGKFADLTTVLSAVKPALSECGLVVTQVVEGATLVTTLWHKNGESISSCTDLITTGGRGNALHTWGGAVTYQRRYTLLALLGLGTEDDDADSLGNKMATASTSRDDDFI
jgi:hypothetical protein